MDFGKNHSFVEPHEIDFEEWYAITLNPSPQEMAKHYDAKDPFRAFKGYVKRLISDWDPDINYELYIELSGKGRFHVHGKLQFLSYTSMIYFYYFLFKNDKKLQYKFGDMMSPLDDSAEFNSWDEYITKQYKFWQNLERDSRLCKIQPKIKNVVDYVSKEDIDVI